MGPTDSAPPRPALFVEVRRSVPAGILRLTSLGRQPSLVATVKLENAVFRPTFDLTVASAGELAVSFPNPRTLQITVHAVARRVARRIPVAVFSRAAVRLRDLAVMIDESAVALVGELTQTNGFGESALILGDRPAICRLAPTAASRPFTFTLSQTVEPDAAALPVPAATLGSRPPPRIRRMTGLRDTPRPRPLLLN